MGNMGGCGQPERAGLLVLSISTPSGLRLGVLAGDAPRWQGGNGLVMIPHVPKGPGTAIEDSRRGIVYDCLEISFREILQYRAYVAGGTGSHHMPEKQVHVF